MAYPRSGPPALVAVAALVAGCHLSHTRGSPGDASPEGDATASCPPSSRPMCAARPAACEPLALVSAACVAGAWWCPEGSAPYVRPWDDELCLPLEGHASPVVQEAPVPVPIDGRCAWVFPIDDGDGEIELGGTETARRCDDLRELAGPIAELEGAVDYVALSASATIAGEPRVMVRGWRFEPGAPFGVEALGVGLARSRDARIVADDRWLFGPELDLGDAMLAHGGFVYAYGCPGTPTWLEEDCLVARAPEDAIDRADAWRVHGERGWGEGTPARVFGSGPHRSAVLADPRGEGFLHVFAIGFGDRILVQRAPAPEGPWQEAVTLRACELPADDPDAFCAGPVVHRELGDPLEPDVLHVGYSIGTTAPDGAARRARDRTAYWPRIVRAALP